MPQDILQPAASLPGTGPSAPVMQTEPPPQPFYGVEAGNSGLRFYGGYVRDEWRPELSGRMGYRVYREMSDNCATIGGMLFAIKHMIRVLRCQVIAADASKEAAEGQKFGASLLDDLYGTWDGFITDVLTMLEYGYAPVEMTFKRRDGYKDGDPVQSSRYEDGRIGIAKLSLRSQETLIKWLMDDKGTVYGLTQQPWNGPMVNIPAQKLLLFRTTEEKGSPEGRSVLRASWRAWWFLKRIEEIEAIGIERDLAGLPYMKVPGSMIQTAAGTDAEAAKAQATLNEYKRIVRDIRQNDQAGVLLPSDRDQQGHLQYELTLLTSGGKRNFDTSTIINRYKIDILSTTLTDFMALGHGARGTQALATTKTELFLTAVQGFVRIIEAELNRKLMPTVWRLNGLPRETMPLFKFEDVEKPELGVLGTYIQQLAGAGMPLFPNHNLESALMDLAGLPKPPEEGFASMDDAGGFVPADKPEMAPNDDGEDGEPEPS